MKGTHRMNHKTEGMKAALRGLMSELGGMNMDRARGKKKPPPDADLGEKKEADLPDDDLPVYRGESAKKKKKLAHAHMGDMDMDD